MKNESNLNDICVLARQGEFFLQYLLSLYFFCYGNHACKVCE